MRYQIKNVTPKGMCIIGSCPAIYEGVIETTPKGMCVVAACPSAYQAKREGKEVYLLVGKQIHASEAGLEDIQKKIGTNEVLIEIPRELIDNKGK